MLFEEWDAIPQQCVTKLVTITGRSLVCLPVVLPRIAGAVFVKQINSKSIRQTPVIQPKTTQNNSQNCLALPNKNWHVFIGTANILNFSA